jgi:hypothetical protein
VDRKVFVSMLQMGLRLKRQLIGAARRDRMVYK